MTQVLVALTDEKSRAELIEVLQDHGLNVIGRDPDRSLAGMDLRTLDCIIATPRQMDDVAGDILELAGSVPVVMLDYQGDARQAVRAMKCGASDYLVAPFHTEELVAAIERGKTATVRTGSAASFNMIGASKPMKELFELIAKASPTDATVLIEGESGTGKELVARAIHAGSPRRHQPLITLNCATVPPQLIESELFGHAPRGHGDQKAGARRGLLEAAEGSTLFLDEIGELPPEVQARLLRIVQVGELRKLGSTSARRVNVRLITATHRNLKQLVSTGQFRDDLYYRLNVLALQIPPLRDRGEDILALADAILTRTAKRLSKSRSEFSEEARDIMMRYPWPGNVRELENAIERAVILCGNGEISADLLAIDTNATPPSEQAPAIQDQTSLADYFVGFVTSHQDQLTETELAAKLGISRKSLWERRQRLNIPRKKTRKRGPRRDDS